MNNLFSEQKKHQNAIYKLNRFLNDLMKIEGLNELEMSYILAELQLTYISLIKQGHDIDYLFERDYDCEVGEE